MFIIVRLARAGRPDDRDELAGHDLEADVGQRGDLHPAHRVDPADVIEGDDRVGHRVSSRPFPIPGRPPPPWNVPPPSRARRRSPPVTVVGVPVWAVLTPVTTCWPSVRPLLISAVVFVTRPTSTGWAVGVPSAPRTRTE